MKKEKLILVEIETADENQDLCNDDCQFNCYSWREDPHVGYCYLFLTDLEVKLVCGPCWRCKECKETFDE